MTDERLRQVEEIVEEVITHRFPETEFRSFRIRPDVDHDGDEVLRITAVYRGSDAELDSDRELGLIEEIQDRLLAIGEEVFPVPDFWEVTEIRSDATA